MYIEACEARNKEVYDNFMSQRNQSQAGSGVQLAEGDIIVREKDFDRMIQVVQPIDFFSKTQEETGGGALCLQGSGASDTGGRLHMCPPREGRGNRRPSRRNRYPKRPTGRRKRGPLQRETSLPNSSGPARIGPKSSGGEIESSSASGAGGEAHSTKAPMIRHRDA